MRRLMTFVHDYPVSPERLFALVSDLDTLEAVTRPWVTFHHLPSGPVREGQVIDVALSVLGVFPVSPYRMRVVRCDAAARRLRSEEDGMGIHKLTHEIEVVARPNGARLVDRVEIDAGWLTPVVASWAWVIYRWRHHVRLRLLQAGQSRSSGSGPDSASS